MSEPRSRMPAAARREQLLQVVLEVFATEGYHDASMNQLAEAAGVTKPVLYQHFPSKRELYLELLRDVGTRLQAAVAVTSQGSTPERLERGMRAFFDFFDREPAAFGVLFGAGVRQDREFARVARQVEADFAGAIAPSIDIEGYDDDDRLLAAHGLVGMAVGMVTQWMRLGRPKSADDMARLAASQAWTGLRGSAIPTPG